MNAELLIPCFSGLGMSTLVVLFLSVRDGRWKHLPSTPVPFVIGQPWKHRTGLRRGGIVGVALLTSGLYASFACAQPTLHHLDPVIFVAFQLALSLLPALVLLGRTGQARTSASVRAGLRGGVLLGGSFLCLALALRTMGLIPTAMLTALDGILASLVSWILLRQRLAKSTLLAMLCAGGGACFLWWTAPSNWQTDLIALACDGLFMSYAFHVECNGIAQGSVRDVLLPFFGGLFVSMAILALALALCFGNWSTLSTLTTTDLAIVGYCGLATVVIPVILSTLLLRALNAVTLSFLALLEPLMSIGVAWGEGSLSLCLFGWAGVVLILASLLLQMRATHVSSSPTASHPRTTAQEDASSSRFVERNHYL